MTALDYLEKQQDEEAMKAANDELAKARSSGNAAGIGDAVRVLSQCYCVQDQAHKAAELATQELAKFRAMGDKMGEAKMLVCLAEANKDVQAAEGALAILAGKDDKLVGEAHLASAMAHIKKSETGDKASELAAASASVDEALGFYQKAKDKKGEAKSLNCLGAVCAAEGNFKEAIANSESAQEIYEALDLQGMKASEYHCTAIWYLEKGNSRKACYYAQEALDMYRDLGGSAKEAACLNIIVKAYLARGQGDQALEEANSGLQRAQEAANSKVEADAYVLLFLVYQAQGEMGDALDQLERAVQSYRDAGIVSKECEILCTASEMRLRRGEFSKAADDSLRALELVRASKDWIAMASALRCYVNAKIEMGESKDAVNVAIDAREVFDKAGATKAEASACLALCQAHRANKKFDRAATAAKAAQEIAYQAEDEKGEAHALSIMADVYMQDEKFDKAVRAAEQARRLWKGLENQNQEANVLNVIAQGQVNMQHKKESGGAAGKLGGKEGWDKALKASTEALNCSREVPDEEHGKLYTATALCTLAEVHLAKVSADEAMDAANEAVALFMESDDELSAAHAWVLCAQADMLKEDWNQARDDVAEGLEIFKNAGDARGEQFAQTVSDLIEKSAPAQQSASMDPQMMAMMMAQMQGGGGGGAAWKAPPSAQKAPAAAAAAPPDAGGGHVAKTGVAGKLDLSSGVNAETVIKTIRDVATGIIGDDDGEEIEADTPLMQAGLTSNTAVLLRDEMNSVLPGINLPPTLIFDYPSIAAMADFIVEKAGG